MKRLLMFVGVAVIAAAMYVAASPASQQSSGPTAKQFAALKKQVASLSKSLKSTKKEGDAVAGFLSDCFFSQAAGVLPINQFGDPDGSVTGTKQGYHYGTGADPTATTNDVYTTALDFDSSSPFNGVYLQGVDPTCVQAAARHRLAHSHLWLRAERAR